MLIPTGAIKVGMPLGAITLNDRLAEGRHPTR